MSTVLELSEERQHKEGDTEMSVRSLPIFCLFPFQGLACSTVSGLTLMRCNVTVHVKLQWVIYK